MEDVVVVTKNEKGKVKLHQARNLTAAGAVGGGFWGMLIGMIFFNPLIGVALGAGAGAISGALTDIGISNKFMKELSETFKPGSSALFVLIRKVTPDKVLEQLKGFEGKIILSHKKDMPRRSRIDAPGALHHIIVRGMNACMGGSGHRTYKALKFYVK